jgi:hypothetical protein
MVRFQDTDSLELEDRPKQLAERQVVIDDQDLNLTTVSHRTPPRRTALL